MVSLRKKTAIAIIGVFLLQGFAGCTTNKSDTSIMYSFSDFNGVETKNIFLDPEENHLNINGKISLSSGKVRLFVKVKDSGKVLYSEEFTSDKNKAVNIGIDNLGGNKDFILGMVAEEAKNLELDLSSEQNLVRTPEIPAATKPSKHT